MISKECLAIRVKCLAAPLAMMMFTSISAMAGTGAIHTTFPDGKTVNGNLYPSKDAVYLTGGPLNEHGSGLSPDGIYFFRVTDPSDATLLSTDDVSCRQVLVTGGKIVGVPAALPPTCATGFHPVSPVVPENGQFPVKLMPYDDTPNNGGEYKVWLSTSPDFTNGDTKTDNFKVDPAVG